MADFPKPDWSKWGLYVEARFYQAVALSINLDPDYAVRRDNMKPHAYQKRFDIAENQGRAKRFEFFTRGDRNDMIDLAEFATWARGIGWSLPDDFPGAGAPKPAENADWPWGVHETPMLRHLADAAKKFWADGYNPATAPTNERVTEWLTDKGVPKRVAEVIAQILRPEDIRPGPRAKKTKK